MAKEHPTQPGESGATPARSEKQPIERAIEFIDQNRVTLPEAVTERDLKMLNAALRHFFADLRHACELFQASEGHDRAGAIGALGAMWRLIALFEQPLAENLHVPILRLQDALMALDDNEVDLMLR